eukprot:CAMPEP_0176436200 /NCGR_PEP_ID=MMETSP0127-20121128/17814_1 /TAXON_ID=938130 /ORGANISM="Platyophrya macrostoma, Strain WH" /LENGTH=197 /DNA_ID=CAMNT_0017819449 /DNA_START=39 /DNA_END=632 /DNA_ORIENTATION=-
MVEFQPKKLVFITGNAKKLEEFKSIIGDRFDVTAQKIDLPELQGTPEEVAREKVKYAFDLAKTAVIVEDTSLCFNAYKGLPGVYIKWFLESLGNDGLYKMLAGFDDKSAYAQCIFSYMAEGMTEPKLFVGRTPGKIVEPRGPKNFGWDPNFQPDGFEQTYAEMDSETKNKISHRYLAVKNMIDYFDDPANADVIQKK